MKDSDIHVPGSRCCQSYLTRCTQRWWRKEESWRRSRLKPQQFHWISLRPRNSDLSVSQIISFLQSRMIRVDELKCCVVISDVFKQDLEFAGVLSLFWFWRHLLFQCTKFIEVILMVPADRGPAVSGAHDTSDSARAGKDLVSALRIGLLTIGPIWSCSGCVARMFAVVESTDVKPNEFVDNRKRSNKLIMGIGHRIGSLENPDQRVVIIKECAKANFSSTAILDFESDAGELACGRGWVPWSVVHRHAEVVRRFPTLRGAGFHGFRLLEWTVRLRSVIIWTSCV